MHDVCLDWPLQKWFDHKVPKTSLAPNLIETHLAKADYREMKPSFVLSWIGGTVSFNAKKEILSVNNKRDTLEIECAKDAGKWLEKLLTEISPSSSIKRNYKSVQANYETAGLKDFLLFWYSGTMDEVREAGLLVL